MSLTAKGWVCHGVSATHGKLIDPSFRKGRRRVVCLALRIDARLIPDSLALYVLLHVPKGAAWDEVGCGHVAQLSASLLHTAQTQINELVEFVTAEGNGGSNSTEHHEKEHE
jgi:hypothetical protein